MAGDLQADARARGSRALLLAFACAGALVVARSVVFLAFEGLYFDSDQAVFGLMAKHLSELRAFPLFMYGQRYLLAVSVWLAAPFIWLFGCQVFAVKLPQLLLNVVVCGLLLERLVRETRLSTRAAFACLLPFLLPSVVASSRLVEHQGGIIEPFVWILLLWRFRSRAFLLGLAAGVGFLNREFTAYGIIALLVIELLDQRWRDRAWWRARLRSAVAFCGLVVAVYLLRPLSTNSFGASPALKWKGSTRALERFNAALGDFMPTLFGWRQTPLGRFAINSEIECGHDWLLVAGWLFGAALALRTTWLWLRRRPALAEAGLPLYFVLVAALTFGVYVILGRGAGHAMYVRYVMLLLLLPVGLVAAALRIESLKSVRVLTAAGVCLLAGANAWDHGRLAFGCARQPPVSRQRLLADALTSRGVRAGVAPYWVAYQVSYLSGEAVRLTASRGPRIQEYEALARREGARAVSITDAPCWPSEEQVADWCVIAATP